MVQRKKVVWNQGQTPEKYKSVRLPTYIPEPDIKDPELQTLWNEVYVGQMCVPTYEMFVNTGYKGAYPLPMTVLGDGYGYLTLKVDHPVLYVGETRVDCQGSKSRVITRSYATILVGAERFLVPDRNFLKPITV